MKFHIVKEVDAASVRAAVERESNVVDAFAVPDDLWEEDSDYPRRDWRFEVGNDDTLLGYWQWVAHRKEAEADG